MTALAVPQYSLRRVVTLSENPQRETKAWIRAVAEYARMSPSALAEAAGLAPSTVTRYLNDATGDIGISQKSLDAIARFSGFSPHQLPPGRATNGMSEPEPAPFSFDDEPDKVFAKAVRVMTDDKPGRDPWRVRGRALDLMGYMPDDVVIVDLNRTPVDGDVVVAQIYDWSGRASTETVMRVFNDPYLLTASSRITVAEPMVVDNKRIVIKGVVGTLLRPSRRNAA